jgi:ribosomal-protein-alanine N-acetyltransferase
MTDMAFQPVVLSGRATRLEPLTAAHAEGLAAAAAPELFTYHFPPRELTTAGFAEQIAAFHSRPNFRPFAIVSRDNERVAGMTSYLDIRPADRGVEVGFTWLAKVHQGTLINPECKYLLFLHAFEIEQAVRVQLKTDLRNVQSQRAIEKLGAVREGVLRKHIIRPDGFVRDSVMYSVTADEWPAVRARLDSRLGYVP